MDIVTLLCALAALLSEIAALLYASRGEDKGNIRRWLILTLLLASAATLGGALTSGSWTERALTLLVLAAFHALSLVQLKIASWRVAIGSGVVGFAAWGILEIVQPGPLASAVMWGIVIGGGGLHVSASALGFARARQAETADRRLLWSFGALLVFIGGGLMLAGSPFEAIGWLLQGTGLASSTYILTAAQLFDVQKAARSALQAALATLITAVIILMGTLAAQAITLSQENVSPLLVFTLSSLVIAAAAVGIHRATLWGMRRLFPERDARKLTHVLRQYSETITGIIHLDEIVNYWNQTLRSVFNVQQGGLILIDPREGSAALQFMGADVPECEGELAKGGILYERLFLHRHSLLQEDLLQAAAYKDVPESERRFFETLAMSVYTPIIVGEGADAEPMGILACGTKMHGQVFSLQDRELLATLANQTGVALRNARLVNDLVTLNEEMKALNNELQVSAENFERLDGVKTDFVTIASHELRTPLAQVRGYTDMIAMMNDGNEEHDPYKMEGYIDGLRKAANRLEGLIGAMLDVSKLDVDSLDLHFALTSMESVIRTAIEPLTDAMNERKLTFSARGLRGLPPIQADSQRLVQAFGNIISNAIKFTPDGGRIEVQGEAVDGENGEASAVLLKVEDTGVGIAPENLELIFEKFFRGYDPSLHSTGATKFMGAGPGLGLTIARGVINGHGGRIWVESTGHDAETLPGSTFFIRLPVVPPEDTHRLSIEETVVAGLPETGAKAYRQSQYDKEKTLPHL